MPSRSASISAWRATTAASATCASTTPTREGGAGVRRFDPRRGAVARLRLGRRRAELYYASDYFDFLYQFAEELITPRPRLRRQPDRRADARATAARSPSPARTAPTATARPTRASRLFREMRDGKHADGAHVLRAKIDMASPNINLRDPAMYRIRHAHAPPHRRQVVHLPDVRLRARRSRTRSRTSPTRSARSSSRTSGRSTTGSTSGSPRTDRPDGSAGICCSGRCRSRSSSRGSTSPTSCCPSAS